MIKYEIMGVFTKKINVEKQECYKNEIVKNFDVIVNPKQYAFWEIKHKDFTAVFYNSGKFVVQGKNPEILLNKLNLENQTQKEICNKDLPILNNDLPICTNENHIGTDESGKGDFFGPLVVAGVYVNEKTRPLFEELGIKDSKTLKDEKMLNMAKEIQKNAVYSVIVISNEKYNELYKKFKNLNSLLAWAHAKVIENILQKQDCKFALSDKFGDERLIKNALQTKGKQINLEQRTKAESDIAVAAASVLARATFVEKVHSMENYYGLKFPKGCNNIVKEAAKEFVNKYGKDRLKEVCKAHFKTYSEI